MSCRQEVNFPIGWDPEQFDFAKFQNDASTRLILQKTGDDSLIIQDIAGVTNRGIRIDPNGGWLRVTGPNLPYTLYAEPDRNIIFPKVFFTVQFDYSLFPGNVDSLDIVIQYSLPFQDPTELRLPVILPPKRTESTLTEIARGSRAIPVRFTPDGSRILYHTNDNPSRRFQVGLMNIDGTNPTLLTNTEASDNYANDVNANGNVILFTRDFGSRSSVYLYNTLSGQENVIAQGNARNQGVAFNYESNQVLYNSDINGNFDVFVYALDGTVTQITQDDVDEFGVSWSERDDILVQTTGDDGLEKISIVQNLSAPVPIRHDDGVKNIPVAYSRLGDILFYSERNNKREIYRMDGSGRDPRMITNNNVFDYPVKFFNNDSQILFYRTDISQNTDIYIIDDVLGGREQRITGFNTQEFPVDVHPNGNLILYWSERVFDGTSIHTVEINPPTAE